MAISLGWRWAVTPGLSIETEAGFQRANSSLSFYEFKRTRGSVGLRYQFLTE